MTERAFATDVQNLLDYLVAREYAIYANTVASGRGRVTWNPYSSAKGFTFNRQHPVLQDYRDWIEGGHYSAVLSDGALLQLSSDWGGGQMVAYRYAYIAAPYAMQEAELRERGFLEVLDDYETDPSSEVILRASIRFDYDLAAAQPGHPVSHATFLSPSCRVPVSGPVSLGQFMRFVGEHFYSRTMGQDSYIRVIGERPADRPEITEEDLKRLHFHQAAF